MDKIKELFYILKSDEDGEQFFYDKDLNKDYGFDYEGWRGKGEQNCRWFCCYLFTKDEIELMKKKIGDGNYVEEGTLSNEENCLSFRIFSMTDEEWENDLQDWFNVRGDLDYYDDEYEDECDVEFGDEFDEHCQECDAYLQKKCDGSYFDGDLVRRALETSRIFPEFIQAYLNIYLKDFRQWWRENIKESKIE